VLADVSRAAPAPHQESNTAAHLSQSLQPMPRAAVGGVRLLRLARPQPHRPLHHNSAATALPSGWPCVWGGRSCCRPHGRHIMAMVAPAKDGAQQPPPWLSSSRHCRCLSYSTATKGTGSTTAAAPNRHQSHSVQHSMLSLVRSEARMSQRDAFSDWGRRQRGDLPHPKPGIDQQPRRRP
jgi:hypothetical protein